MSEREAGVARSAQHAIYVLPHAPNVVARFLGPALDRVAADADATQLIVLTADADTALAISDVARAMRANETAPIVPITAVGRGSRLLASRTSPAIAATPSMLVSLLRSSSVKLDQVRTVVIAWADELFDAREEDALEIVLSEVPKEASRVVVADRLTAQVEALAERHLRRAPRHAAAPSDELAPELAIRYVTTPESGRGVALRRVLDDLDPPSVIVIAHDEQSVTEARSSIASLGYEGSALVRVESAPSDEQAALVVFYDLPETADQVRSVAATTPAQVVALVAPRQVAALRRVTTGVVEPLDVSQAGAKARARDERVRSALRAELQSSFPAREIIVLEPLLAEFDGIEIAAAALRLIERERGESRTRRVEAERPVERATERAVESTTVREGRKAPDRPAPRADTGFARVFLSIGDRDGVRPGDLVGAITGESGITSDRIGKIEIRDGHTVAEIAAADAPGVIDKMNGVSMKGKRIIARLDERPATRDRDARPGRDANRSGGAGRGFRDRGKGGPREGARGGFGARGRERPSREGTAGTGGGEGRFSREGRPPRGPARERFGASDRRPRRDDDRPRGRGDVRDRGDDGRVPRATHERQEWTDRADRVRNARRPRRDDA